jgi:hypothetical protein
VRPQSRSDLKEYCLRRLGKPVLNIEIEDSQAEDRIDDVLQRFMERHYAGSFETIIRIPFTSRDEHFQTIKMPKGILAVLEIFESGRGDTSGSAEEFERLNYLLSQGDLWEMARPMGSNHDLSNYETTLQYISLLRRYFSPSRSFNYSMATGELRVTSGRIIENNFILARIYRSVDPVKSMNVYDDQWIKDYTTALFKRQWGENLKKYDGVQMVGGVTVQGQKIWDEAMEEIAKLDELFTARYELPIDFFWG